MTIGLCTIISVADMQVITYAFETYELALAQALENMKGVEGRIERFPERPNPNNGTRETVFKLPMHMELVQVQEVEVGSAVHPVPGEMLTKIKDVPWHDAVRPRRQR